MKKIFIIIYLIIFTGCIGLDIDKQYRIKKFEGDYEYDELENIIYLTPKMGEKREKYGHRGYGRVYLTIEVPNHPQIPNYAYNNLLIEIRSGKETYIIGNEIIYPKENVYNKPDILNDVVITKKSGNRIILKREQIKYLYYDDNLTFRKVWLNLPEPLSGPIILELGKVKIGDEIYDIPKIYMQKYRVTESYSLLGDILNESGEEFGPLYHSEGWVDD